MRWLRWIRIAAQVLSYIVKAVETFNELNAKIKAEHNGATLQAV
jgi:hypothetical protein